MKQCLNCNTINEQEAVACKSCRMRDKFAPLAPTTAPPLREVPAAPVQWCRNCGQDAQGQAQCPHCRFPLRPGLKANSVAIRSYTAANTPVVSKAKFVGLG